MCFGVACGIVIIIAHEKINMLCIYLLNSNLLCFLIFDVKGKTKTFVKKLQVVGMCHVSAC